MRIPHEFNAYGKTWRVRWWRDRIRGFESFNPRLHDAHIDEGTRTITMHPDLRGRPRRAFEAFVHEVLHIVNFEERKRTGRSKYRIRHELMYHLDEPLAFTLMAMGVSFRCVCVRCRSRSFDRRAGETVRAAFDAPWERELQEELRRRGIGHRPNWEEPMAQGNRGGNKSRGRKSSSSASRTTRSSRSGSRSGSSSKSRGGSNERGSSRSRSSSS